MKWYEDPEYQLMCEKVEEIQKEKTEIDFGDYYALHGSNRTTLHTNLSIKKIGTMFWLPSQEDLQEIYERYLQKRCDICEYGFNVAFTFTVLEEFLKTFFNLNTAGRIRKGWYPKSWEQLWLAFVYHELYQKIWNGEKWIKK